MSKYYNKEIPTEIHAVYGGRQSGKSYYEFKKLEENERLKSRINKAIEYIGNGNLGIPRKTREKFIKILKGEENENRNI